MKQRSVRACALSLVVVLGGAAVAPAAPGPTRRARLGTRYIVERQTSDGSVPGFSPAGSTADAVIAMVAARRAPRAIRRALLFLEKAASEASLGQKAKIVLAVVAAGGDPRSFGGRDLVADIKASQQPDGQYAEAGDFTAVTTHALAMLALEAAGEPHPASADRWLVDAQCPDGGWQYDRPHDDAEDAHCQLSPGAPGSEFDAASDTNVTAYAVQALAATAVAIDPAVDPFDYFASARDKRKGGYRYSHQEILFGTQQYTDANSTALVLQAFVATGRDVPGAARKALGALQYPRRCGRTRGAFAYTWVADDNGKLRRSPSRREAALKTDVSSIGATIAAIPGLVLKALPLPPAEVTRAAPARKRC
ncbi:MAG TPA: hypothetical protein VG929_09075 [Actinomycetota bacterium]|nr:hypothetical protein [Actinomycetota bacterium]